MRKKSVLPVPSLPPMTPLCQLVERNHPHPLLHQLLLLLPLRRGSPRLALPQPAEGADQCTLSKDLVLTRTIGPSKLELRKSLISGLGQISAERGNFSMSHSWTNLARSGVPVSMELSTNYTTKSRKA